MYKGPVRHALAEWGRGIYACRGDKSGELIEDVNQLDKSVIE